MPISIQLLRYAADRPMRMTAKTLNEARVKHLQTAFLCHSHRDKDIVLGLQNLLNENGWNLYIDWQDSTMPEQPTKITALKIKGKIKELDWFLFLATPNSASSRWCPWEIGFADNIKTHEKILIVPTVDNSGKYYGNEYLQLYRRIEQLTQAGLLAIFDEGKTSGGIYLKNL